MPDETAVIDPPTIDAQTEPEPKPKARPKGKAGPKGRPKGKPVKSESLKVPPAKARMSKAARTAVTRGKVAIDATERQYRETAGLLKQVSDATRLRIVMRLAESPLNVGEICRELGNASQPAISHHLAILRTGRQIEPARRGKTNTYSLTDDGRKLADAIRGLIGG